MSEYDDQSGVSYYFNMSCLVRSFNCSYQVLLFLFVQVLVSISKSLASLKYEKHKIVMRKYRWIRDGGVKCIVNGDYSKFPTHLNLLFIII